MAKYKAPESNDSPDLTQISYCIKKNSDWKVFLRVHPDVQHSVVQDVMKEIGNAGQADVIFGTWQVAAG